MVPLVLGEELEDGGLGEGDADDALEGGELEDDLVLLEVGGHALGEPDDARDAEGRHDGLDDAEGGGGFGELVFERAHDGAEGPDGDVQGQLGGEDLEDHEPDHLGVGSQLLWGM